MTLESSTKKQLESETGLDQQYMPEQDEGLVEYGYSETHIKINEAKSSARDEQNLNTDRLMDQIRETADQR